MRLDILLCVYVRDESMQKIVVGSKGSLIAEVTRAAELALHESFSKRVNLSIVVKIGKPMTGLLLT